jgi:hypothetical protein
MTRIRWFDNAPIDKRDLRPYEAFKVFAFVYFVGCLIGFVCQFSLGFIDDDAGLVLMFDIMLMPLSFPFIALIFLVLHRWLVSTGRFGLATSAVLGAFAVFVVTLMVSQRIFGADTTSFIDVLLSTNCAVTYGMLIGTMFWLKIAIRRPGSFLKDIKAELSFGNWTMGAVLLILLWQQVFWRIGS